MQLQLPVGVGAVKGLQPAVKPIGGIDAAVPEQPGTIGHPLGAVVIPADEIDGNPRPAEPGDKIRKSLHGAGRRIGLVIDVPGNQHRLHIPVPGDLPDLAQHLNLIRKQVVVVEPLAQMQVRTM